MVKQLKYSILLALSAGMISPVQAFCQSAHTEKPAAPVSLAMNRPSPVAAGLPMNSLNETAPGPDHRAVLRSMIGWLRDRHFSSPDLNDSFSAAVWTVFIDGLDNEKAIFLRQDIDFLKNYEHSLGKEMQASSLEFFDTAMHIYRQRVTELMSVYHSLLEKPVSMDSRHLMPADRKKAGFPADEAGRKALWQDKICFEMLKKAVEPGDSLAANYKAKEREQWNVKTREKIGKRLDHMYQAVLTETGTEEKFSLYLNCITTSMDPHSLYFAPVDARMMQESISHRYFGLGMELRTANGEVIINRLLPGSSASRSGLLKINDRIISISGPDNEMVDISGYTVTEAAKMIRGEKGTMVRLQVAAPGGGMRTVALQRGEIIEEGAGAQGAMIRKDGRKIGYIFLPEFYIDAQHEDGPHCSRDVERIVRELKAQGAEELVIDLRNNPGGSLTEVVQMASLFLPNGPVVQIKDKQQIQQYVKPAGEIVYDGPMAVLVNEYSASASEIFAAAMQDYHRAVIIGSTTFGKGTAQTDLPMGKMGDKAKGIPAINYGSVRTTIDKFYRINGGSTQLKGVIPDLALPDGNEYLPIHEQDRPSALAWDQIPAATYTPLVWKGLDGILAETTAKVGQDSSFRVIQTNMTWLKERQDQPLVLDLKQYRQQTAERNAHMASILRAQQMDSSRALDIRKLEMPKPKANDTTTDKAGAQVPNTGTPAIPGMVLKIGPGMQIQQGGGAGNSTKGSGATGDNGTSTIVKGNEETVRQWLSKLSRDIYLNQSVDLLNRIKSVQ